MNISWLVTGALPAVSIPGILVLLRSSHPHVHISPYVTHNAERLVTRTALEALSNSPSSIDTWGKGTSQIEDVALPAHIHLETTNDAFVVAPASLDFVTRFTNHDCSTPFTLALQCTRKPIIIAPCLPPGGLESIAYRDALVKIEKLENVHLLSPVHTVSSSLPNESSSGFGDPLRLINFILEKLSRVDGKDI